MDARKIIESMMAESGTSASALSLAMGRAPGYVSATLCRNSTPKLDTFAEMAEAMGYRLLLEKDGRVLQITPIADTDGWPESPES